IYIALTADLIHIEFDNVLRRRQQSIDLEVLDQSTPMPVADKFLRDGMTLEKRIVNLRVPYLPDEWPSVLLRERHWRSHQPEAAWLDPSSLVEQPSLEVKKVFHHV